MNHPVMPQQGPHPAQTAQNVGQQRQMPNVQQKPQNVQQPQARFTSYDPKLALFVLERRKADRHWDDVEAQIQHISYQDLKSTLDKHRRKKFNVKASLDEITSATVKRLVNELVEIETEKLWERNPTIQYKIAHIDTEWRQVRGGREIKRVSIMLETEPSGFPDPNTIKPAAVGGQGVQDVKPAMKPAMAQPGQMNNPGAAAQQQQQQQQQQPKMVPQHPQQHMGQHQFEQQQRPQPGPHPNPPPPPPPPPGQGQHGNPPPPPPPPGGMHPNGGHPQQHMAHTQGIYAAPAYGAKQQPHIEVIDVHDRYMRHNRPRSSGLVDSSEDEEDWSTESGSGNSVRVRGGKHNRGRRGAEHFRSNHIQRPKHRSSSKLRSRSKGKGSKHVDSRNSAQYHARPSRRHKHSDAEDYPSDTKYHSSSSSSDSARSRDSKRHSKHHHHRRHNSHNNMRDLSPSGLKLRSSKKYKNHRTSHEGSEASWHGSDTSSAPTSAAPSSAYGDRVWDEHMRPSASSPSHHRKPAAYHSRVVYDEYSRRPEGVRYDDYPHQQPPGVHHSRRDSYIDDQFAPHTALHAGVGGGALRHENPFSTRQYAVPPPALRRGMTYAGDAQAYPQVSEREREREADALNLMDVAEALRLVRESKQQQQQQQQQQQRGPPLQRRYSAQPGVNRSWDVEDEWDMRGDERTRRFGVF